jgi:hypothetical protein
MRRVGGKFGDKWGMLVKKGVESCVKSNEKGTKRVRWASDKTRVRKIRDKVVDIEGTEVAKGAKLGRSRRERRNSKIDQKRSVIRWRHRVSGN